jgi:sulfate permease, SulP family
VTSFTEPVTRWLRSVRPDRRDLKTDAVAGVPGAIGSVPDGMAASVLAGVNPVYGLYASFAGPIVGGLTARTKLMVIAPTSAAALAVGSALTGIDPNERAEALFLITLLAGGLMILAAVFRLGRYVRFVSHSVMIGFLTGVAVNIVLGQIPDLAGAPADGPFALAKTLDVLTDLGSIDAPSLLTGVGALALLVALNRTRLGSMSALVALIVPTVVLIVIGNDSVTLVSDLGDIPQGVPTPHLPDLGALSIGVVTAALSVTVIVLVQGAGVAESAPNPDGSRAGTNGDFAAQGYANLASGLFRGLPVGGSVGNTALNVAAGARSRWASILSGVWLLLVLVLFGGLVGRVALPTLAAVLIFAAVSSVKPGEVAAILRTAPDSAIALTTTFLATMFLPIQVAVGIGVALSLLLQLRTEAMDLKLVEIVPQPNGTFVERPPPPTLPSRKVTALDVYGSLLYAGSRTLQVRLPDPAGATAPVVVLRLRGRTSLGATFFVVLADYVAKLDKAGGRLYLSGVDPAMLDRMTRSRMDADGPLRAHPATEVVGQSTLAAYQAGEAWLIRSQDPQSQADSRDGADGERRDPEDGGE